MTEAFAVAGGGEGFETSVDGEVGVEGSVAFAYGEA